VTLEIVLMWVAVTAYALAGIAAIIGFVFRAKPLLGAVVWLGLAGLVAHAAAIIVRWDRVGHAPYLGFYEVVSSYAFVGVVIFLVLAWRKPALTVAGAALMPAAFLFLGAAMLAPKSDAAVSGALASYWLTIHVSLAKLSYGSFLTGFGLAVVYLVLTSTRKSWADRLAPASLTPEIVDDLVFKFTAAGFIFLAIMVVSGAIWANEAWGRYWGWDPIETWSLIWWFAYAFIIHLRVTMGWRGRRFAWAVIAGVPIMLFALVGVVLVYESIHGAYLLPQ
jgi:cytochrome c-type biogenesis protein CcsB